MAVGEKDPQSMTGEEGLISAIESAPNFTQEQFEAYVKTIPEGYLPFFWKAMGWQVEEYEKAIQSMEQKLVAHLYFGQ